MVCLDLVGPQLRSHRQHTWLLVMQDWYTKWVEVATLHNATGKNITDKFREAIILRNGCPDTVVTDNGKQFVSRDLSLKENSIQHQWTAPYIPYCNPVERTNRMIKTMVSQYIGENHKNWNKYLPEIVFAYNTAISTATSFHTGLPNQV